MFFRRRQMERDLADEFRFHLEQQIESGIARGLSAEAARAEAMSLLDRMELRKEECRDVRGWNLIESTAQDLRYAARVLRKSPVFTSVAILSLALGIGANTAVFSLMNALLMRPLPVRQADRLRLLSIDGQRVSFTYPMFEQIRNLNHSFDGVFAWTGARFQTPVGSDMALLSATYASGNYFGSLGVAPQLGRVFGSEDDQPAGGMHGLVAVLSDAYWSSRFGRSASIVGQPLVINGMRVTVLGVMPPGFFGAEVGRAPDLWVPLNMVRQLEDARCIASRSCWILRIMGRLRPDTTEAMAAAELRALSPEIMKASVPDWRSENNLAMFLRQVLMAEPGSSGYSFLRNQIRLPLRVLMALVGLVLLIACANLANLLSARASARQKEIAVRRAMGAGRSRIIRQLLTESLFLAAGGAAAGFLVAALATRALAGLLSTTEQPVIIDVSPDWRVLLFTAAVATVTGLLFGLAPALGATRGRLGAAMKERAHQIRGTRTGFGAGRLLLGAQIAISIVLLAAATLFSASLTRLVGENPGFDPKGVQVIRIDTSKRPEKNGALLALFGRILQRTRALPGVESATLLSTTPLTNGGWDQTFAIPGRTDLTEEQRDADINAISTGFFTTMRIPVLKGRDFTESDSQPPSKVTLISENAARRWFPKGDALGSYITMDDEQLHIIGITGNSKYFNLRETLPLTVYVPFRNQGGNVAIRTSAPLPATLAAVRGILREVAPGTPILNIRTMEQQVDESLSTERLTAWLSLFIAGLALLLTAVGLYGILAYAVTRRTGEIGIRMALGARQASVVWLMVQGVLGEILAGVVVGVAGVAGASRFIASLLYGVKANDPRMIALSVALLAAVCGVAAFIPARRASRLDPMRALREE